jgi:predicted RND superfamily exporter protein
MKNIKDYIERFEAKFGPWVIKRRWWIITGTVLALMIILNGMQFLTVNMDGRVFFGKDNPQLQALEELENIYNRTENVLFVIEPKDGDVFTTKTLSIVEELTEFSWQIPYSNRVNSISNFQHTRVDEDNLNVEDLIQNAASLSKLVIEEKREIVISEPMLVNSLISPSGHVTGININILLPGESDREVPEITNFARNMLDDFREKYPEVNFYLAGSIPMSMTFGEASQSDMSNLIPLMFLALVILVGISLRSFTGTLSTSIMILISMITGLGMAGWLGFVLNAASANAPIIILTLAVADSVHILATMFQQMRLGKSKFDAISESLRVNLQPVLLTTLATVIGFLTMNFSDAPPFRDLGNIVAMGVTSAFIYSVTFLPALLAVLPIRVKSKSQKANSSSLSWLANFVINRRKPVYWVTLVVIGVMIAGILKIELQDEWVKYFDKSFDIRNATDFAEENLTGFHSIEYSLKSGIPGGINDPKYLLKVEEFANWYRSQPKVVHVNVITETMKRLNKNMNNDNESFYKIPNERELAAQYLLLYEMSLPFGLDLNDQINVDKSATRMIVTLRRTTTTELRQMEIRGNEWLKQNAPASMYSSGSGIPVIWAHLSARNINSLLGGSFWALLLISGLMILALRSFKLGVLSLIPNLAPAFMAFGFWGIVVGEAGLGISIIAAMTLGIVVDDTVHFMSKYLRARRELNMVPADAIRYSFNTVGMALWITSITLVVGFMILTLSGFRMNSDMGLMAAITITLALALDFLFLPTLLMKAERKTIKNKNELKEKSDEKANIKPGNVSDAVPVRITDRHSTTDSR